MSTPNPCWVPAFIAFDTLRKQYEASNFYADDEVCRRVANDTLLRRLEAGQLPARAAQLKLAWDYNFSRDSLEPIVPDTDGKAAIPTLFWRYFQVCKSVDRQIDWLAGDFAFTLSGVEVGGFIPSCDGHVIGLEVDANHLPPDINSKTGPAQSAGTRSGGRPAANWWPDFAEELAVYIHENGIPDGQGHDGQSSLIDAVFARMVERGKPEPGRGTVQAVMNAVLRRIRSAGN
jgi:hypothetical protein